MLHGAQQVWSKNLFITLITFLPTGRQGFKKYYTEIKLKIFINLTQNANLDN